MGVPPLGLCERDVHVWTVRIQASDELAANFERVLTSDEMDRAARFRFDGLRHSYVIARGTLRSLLGRYLDVPPASVRLNYGSRGKPALPSDAGLEFNTTHSGGLAAFAFTVGCPIGVDVEQIRPLTELNDIASRFFCREEAAEILSLPPSERERAFFLCWTRKEAYIKAIGDGLSTPLDDFRVTLRDHETARLVHLGQDIDAARAWTLEDLGLASGYAAALAYHDRQRSLSVFPIADAAEFIGEP